MEAKQFNKKSNIEDIRTKNKANQQFLESFQRTLLRWRQQKVSAEEFELSLFRQQKNFRKYKFNIFHLNHVFYSLYNFYKTPVPEEKESQIEFKRSTTEIPYVTSKGLESTSKNSSKEKDSVSSSVNIQIDQVFNVQKLMQPKQNSRFEYVNLCTTNEQEEEFNVFELQNELSRMASQNEVEKIKMEQQRQIERAKQMEEMKIQRKMEKQIEAQRKKMDKLKGLNRNNSQLSARERHKLIRNFKMREQILQHGSCGGIGVGIMSGNVQSYSHIKSRLYQPTQSSLHRSDPKFQSPLAKSQSQGLLQLKKSFSKQRRTPALYEKQNNTLILAEEEGQEDFDVEIESPKFVFSYQKVSPSPNRDKFMERAKSSQSFLSSNSQIRPNSVMESNPYSSNKKKSENKVCYSTKMKNPQKIVNDINYSAYATPNTVSSKKIEAKQLQRVYTSNHKGDQTDHTISRQYLIESPSTIIKETISQFDQPSMFSPAYGSDHEVIPEKANEKERLRKKKQYQQVKNFMNRLINESKPINAENNGKKKKAIVNSKNIQRPVSQIKQRSNANQSQNSQVDTTTNINNLKKSRKVSQKGIKSCLKKNNL